MLKLVIEPFLDDFTTAGQHLSLAKQHLVRQTRVLFLSYNYGIDSISGQPSRRPYESLYPHGLSYHFWLLNSPITTLKFTIYASSIFRHPDFLGLDRPQSRSVHWHKAQRRCVVWHPTASCLGKFSPETIFSVNTHGILVFHIYSDNRQCILDSFLDVVCGR